MRGCRGQYLRKARTRQELRICISAGRADGSEERGRDFRIHDNTLWGAGVGRGCFSSRLIPAPERPALLGSSQSEGRVGEAVLRSGQSQAHLHRVPRGPAPPQPPWEKSPGRPPPPRSLCGTARAPSPQPALHDAGPRAQRRLWNWLDRAGGCVASRSAQATEFVHFKTGSFPVV